MQTLYQTYQNKVESGDLKPDPAQDHAAKALQRLHDEVMAAHDAPKQNLFQKLTGLGARDKDAPKGLYLWGGVGRGKTMLMDMFFAHLPDDIKRRRVHFHSFMIEVHSYVHSRRESDGIREGVDATLPLLAARIAEQSRILCFDEFHVTDVADAMILGRLFTALFDQDVIIICTSNWVPDRLYEGGLQRVRFLPFIDLLKDRLEVIELDNGVDYRSRAVETYGSYFYPINDEAIQKADSLFAILSDHADMTAAHLDIRGHVLHVPITAGGVARFTFDQLCRQAFGAEDYIALTHHYHTVFLDDVPVLSNEDRNELKRFMTLVDILYDWDCRLIVTAEAEPQKLYIGHDHAEEFLRTISRLHEMGSW